MFRHKSVLFGLLAAAALVTVLLFPQAAFAQPPVNDDRSNSTVITTLPFDEGIINTEEASLAPEDPIPTCLPGGFYYDRTVWYSFTPQTATPVDILLEGSSYSLIVTIFRLEADQSLTEVRCDFNPGNIYGFTMEAGQTYYIMVSAWIWIDYPPPTIGGNLHFQMVSAVPANDGFANAQIVTGMPAYIEFHPFYATVETGEPSPACLGGATIYHTVWYAYSPDQTGRLSIDRNRIDGYSPFVALYEGEALTSLAEAGCYQGDLTAWFDITAGHTYFIQVGGLNNLTDPGMGHFIQMQVVIPPANDSFAGAQEIGSLPFWTSGDMTWASLESGEPIPTCGNPPERTLWYKFTPNETGSTILRTWNTPVQAVYTGDAIGSLSEVACRNWGDPVVFNAEAGRTYYIQVGKYSWDWQYFEISLDYTPQPSVSIAYSPGDPSSYDTIDFWAYVDDPVGQGVATWAWDFGDGTTFAGCCTQHRYAKDGDYTVSFAITTTDGRSASTTTLVSVRTHDITITRFSLPGNVRVNQTRPIYVYIANPRYPELVEVQLYRSVPRSGTNPEGWEWFGTLRQTVPVGSMKQPTKFAFSYTFNQQDLQLGKVNFRAEAYIIDARDAVVSDNIAISLPVKVSK